MVYENCLNMQLECVGSVESGILAAVWSPDLDIVALYTGLALFPIYFYVPVFVK